MSIISNLLRQFAEQDIGAAADRIKEQVPKFIAELKDNLQGHRLLRQLVQSQAKVDDTAKALQHATRNLDADDPSVSDAEIAHSRAVGSHGELLDVLDNFLRTAHVPDDDEGLPGLEPVDVAHVNGTGGWPGAPIAPDHDCPKGCIPRCSPCEYLDKPAAVEEVV